MVKEYNELLELCKGLVKSSLAQAADGIQFKDVLQVLSENLDKAMAAYEGCDAVAAEWKESLKECLQLTQDFVVDVACDLLKIAEKAPTSFKETSELMAALSGIVGSVIAKLPGGFQSTEILPVVFENFQNLIVGVDGADKIGAEAKENLRSFLKNLSKAALDLGFKVKEAFEPKPVA